MILDAALLSQHAPDAPVAWTSEKTTTAAELVAHVAGLAELLPPADGPEEVVVICRDRYRFLVAILAAWKRGYAAALPPNPQVETIRAIRQRPGVRTVIHDVDGADERGIDVRAAAVVRAAREKVGRLPYEVFEPPAKDRHLLTVYTSGSTGEHTACPKTTRQVLGEATLLANTFAMHETPRVLSMVPAYHIYGLLFGVLTPLACGGCFHRATPLHAAEVGAILAGGVDALVAVPAHLRGLLVAKAGELPPVRRVFSSAAPLPPTLAAELHERFGWRVTEGFGSSETGGIAWRESGGQGPWIPFEGVRVRAADDGRMLVDSPYIHPDDPHPYVGADRVEVSADGTFTHLGRVDGVLKIAGVRVALAEVESRLRSIAGVKDAAVTSRKIDGPREHEILALVVTEDGITVSDVRNGLRKWLAPVALPRRIKRIAELPRTAGGKVRHADVLAHFGLATEDRRST